MAFKQRIINARLIIKPFRKSKADNIREIFIALLIFAQKDQVAVFTRLFIQMVLSNINLAADHGMDTLGLHGHIKVDGAVKHAVICHGAGVLTKKLKALSQFFNPARAVEQAVFRMKMQIGKSHAAASDQKFYNPIIPLIV